MVLIISKMCTYHDDPAACGHVAVVYGAMLIHENGPNFPLCLGVKPFGGQVESTSTVNEDDILQIFGSSRFLDFLFEFDVSTDWSDAVLQIF